ncbi:urea transport system ATP-binding protein [Treponema bryantii]|uniref:Urea transport system ATP-binding protein n=1 Tax=Treponema bryantii TaxID=163 RepID=A0A1H9JCT9_9SPIR|nr:urea ABC transporter ATP-binding protein UrtD [Treponema bryantii]SEQ84577.1 urea transport system ATP-binding protein [Treponema bryantii]
MSEVNINVTPVIEIDNISVSFEGFKALTDVTTKIMPHKVHFFIGPNGAGKTTLLDIICGKTRPSKGKIIYHGGKDLGIRKYVNMDLTKLSESEIVSEGIGRKFQAPSVFTSLTVWENMEISLKGSKSVWGSLFFKISDKQKEQIENILDFISLSDKKNEKASSLSHGQKQWLEIGMLLVQEPVVLLLDEPVAGMGKEETLKTGQLIRKISEKYAVVVVEHDMEFVRAVADRVTVMHEGKILVEGTAEDALADEKVRAVYLGRGKFHKSGTVDSSEGELKKDA